MRSTAENDDTADTADTNAGVGKRLALLVAALLWDGEGFYADIYDRRVGQGGGPSPDLRLVEFTEDGRVEILADGREYVLRVESKSR